MELARARLKKILTWLTGLKSPAGCAQCQAMTESSGKNSSTPTKSSAPSPDVAVVSMTLWMPPNMQAEHLAIYNAAKDLVANKNVFLAAYAISVLHKQLVEAAVQLSHKSDLRDDAVRLMQQPWVDPGLCTKTLN